MPSFGQRSKKNLSECHPLLQELFNEVVKYYDCAIIEGHRPQEEQDKAFHAGKSKLKFPQSKHNKTPSLAVDAVPFPIDWNDSKRFYYFGGLVIATAKAMGIDIRWGGNWDSDSSFKDQSFHDLPHFELRSSTRNNGYVSSQDQDKNGSPERNKSQHLPDGPSEDDINVTLEDIERDLGL